MPIVMMEPAAGSYVFQILNFADEPLITYLRLQPTWVDATQPTIVVSGFRFESGLGFSAVFPQMVNWRGKSI